MSGQPTPLPYFRGLGGTHRLERRARNLRRAIFAPVYAPLVAGLTAGALTDVFTLSGGVAAAYALTIGAYTFSERARSRYDKYGADYRAHRRDVEPFVAAWPDWCAHNGWYAGGGDAQRLPELIDVVVTDTQTVVTWRPLGNQKVATWDAASHQLMLVADAQTKRWEHLGSGVLRTELGTKPLAELYEVKTLAQFRADVLGKAGEFILGPREGGGVAIWKPSAGTPHLFIWGRTDGGKGTMMRNILMAALMHGWVISGIDAKGMGEFSWLQETGVQVARKLEDQVQALRDVYGEYERRRDYLAGKKVANWNKLPKAERDPRLVFFIDEVVGLLEHEPVDDKTTKQGKAAAARNALRSECAYLLRGLAARGRAANMHILMNTQRGDIELLGGDGAGAMRDQFVTVATGDLSNRALLMAFDLNKGDAEAIGGMTGIQGRFLTTGLYSGDRDFYFGQGWYVDEDAPAKWDLPEYKHKPLERRQGDIDIDQDEGTGGPARAASRQGKD